ncbi:MAG: hypothetical protein NTU84_00530 [Verrucomicrobia bacterium]|nr:hypothetical protein [Verrucomicrobiota bacterium]
MSDTKDKQATRSVATNGNAVRLQRLARLRGKASREGMRRCLEWIDSCRELGWNEDQLDDLELLFWQYRDSNGEFKQPSDEVSDAATHGVQSKISERGGVREH